MAKKNPLLQKIEQANRACVRAGMDTAWQEFWDLLCIVLHNPEVMGKDTFGKKRLLKIRAAIAELEEEVYPAFSQHPEADYYQEKIDTKLREIFGEGGAPFKDRYPYLPECDYSKRHRDRGNTP